MTEVSLTRFRRCTSCNCTKPATPAFFHRGKNFKDGLAYQCKICRRLYAVNKWHEDPEANRAKDRANKAKFRKRRSQKELERYHANREAIRQRRNAAYATNRERMREIAKQRYYKDVEETRRKRREYYAENTEYLLAVNKDYRRRNPHIVKEMHARRRARLNESEGDHTFEEIWQMVEDQGHLCAYCESPLMGDFHVDHMTPLCRRGRNDWTNLAIACPKCNHSKKDKTAEEFMNTYQRG